MDVEGDAGRYQPVGAPDSLTVIAGDRISEDAGRRLKDVAMVAGPLVALVITVLASVAPAREDTAQEREDSFKIASTFAGAVWICLWWLTGAVPVAITSLIPLFLFPLLGILDSDAVAKSYMNDTITLFLGSFVMALAVEHHQVHKRLALKILLTFGGKSMDPHSLLLGFCVGPAFLSMFISNSAAAVMMVPMAMGVVHKVEQGRGNDVDGSYSSDEPLTVYCRGVVLAIAYAVAIGGLSTLTGTGPNLILAGMWTSMFPDSPPISYLQWFTFAFPVGLLFLLFLWLLLILLYCPPSTSVAVSASLNRSVVEQEYCLLGPISFAELMVLSNFSVLALLWVTRSIGEHGWSELFQGLPGDGTVSILMATLLFVIPDGKGGGARLMDWKMCKELPWDIVLLLGGGFALADGIQVSGLSQWVTDHLDFLDSLPYLLISPVVCLLVAILTQFTSNNSAATIVLPLLAQVAVSMNANPLLFMIPATLGATFAFTLPVSTPPNAIAFSTGLLTMRDMARTGFVMIAIGILLVSLAIPTLGAMVFGLDSPLISAPFPFQPRPVSAGS